jgi:hypothetical protein
VRSGGWVGTLGGALIAAAGGLALAVRDTPAPATPTTPPAGTPIPARRSAFATGRGRRGRGTHTRCLSARRRRRPLPRARRLEAERHPAQSTLGAARPERAAPARPYARGATHGPRRCGRRPAGGWRSPESCSAGSAWAS